MSGRGRGGKSGTLTQEQMQALGCMGKDRPQVATAPPPTFPPLLTKPVTAETTTAQNYQILWKEDFLNRMRDSPYYVMPNCQRRKHSEWSAKRIEGLKQISEPEFNYQLMPSELQLTSRKRRREWKPKLESAKRNFQDTLKALEEKELKDVDEEREEKAKDNTDSEHEDEDGDAEAALDDEMDEENDYGNSYFDNGEAYNEEEDNLDDGPIY